MALLTTKDLEQINKELDKNINTIEKLTKRKITKLYEEIYNSQYNNECIGIVPITSGNGIINGFSESILYTLQIFNMNAFITKNKDVSGYLEAVNKKADIILMADDLTYLAHNLTSNKISNNHYATAKIYSEVLINIELEDNIKSKEVLIIGLGNVGRQAIQIFLDNKYDIYVYDSNKNIVENISRLYPNIKKYNFDKKQKFLKILEATPNSNTIPESILMKETIISTPGIPIALDNDLIEKYNINLIMEPLGLGTISMIYNVL